MDVPIYPFFNYAEWSKTTARTNLFAIWVEAKLNNRSMEKLPLKFLKTFVIKGCMETLARFTHDFHLAPEVA